MVLGKCRTCGYLYIEIDNKIQEVNTWCRHPDKKGFIIPGYSFRKECDRYIKKTIMEETERLENKEW